MKFSLFISLIFLSFATSHAHNHSLSIDVNDTKNLLKWEGAKALVQSTHDGTLKLSKAKINTNEKGEITGGEFTIDMRSLTVLDLKDPKQNAKLRGHLLSDDFFSVEKFPEAEFKITKLTPKKTKNHTHQVTGDLTIKGIKHSVNFPAKIERKDGETTISAEFPVDRTKYDIRFNSGRFFKDLAANSVIKDEFTVKFDLTAK